MKTFEYKNGNYTCFLFLDYAKIVKIRKIWQCHICRKYKQKGDHMVCLFTNTQCQKMADREYICLECGVEIKLLTGKEESKC